MDNSRVRVVIAAIEAAIGVVGGLTIGGAHHSQAPVTISYAQPASPDPSTGDPGIDQTSAAGAISPDAADAAPAKAPSHPSVSPLIYVHVAGAVKHPDIYALPAGSRVVSAVKAAGGPTADADVDAINLAEKIVDGEKIYVPRKGETEPPPSVAAGNTIGLASSTPAPTDTSTPSTNASSAVPPSVERSHNGPGHSSNKLTDPSQGKVNINTASAEELERLPGVGPATAARIIAYRQQNGGFKSPNDLMDIGGIGDKKFAKLAPFVTIH